ncbi:FAD/NAD(P)-binding domain-containing protein [Nemania sp. FL0031]|nr:FAD/NAD(P)-binding domain-containing protein [Nemania sp. FL0031]
MPPQHSPQPLTAGIVGAGIAGLSAAIALRRAGFQVEVYERSRLNNELGAAICTPQNAAIVLRRWGFGFEASDPTPNLCMRYARAGDLVTVFHENIKSVMGAPCLSFYREDLHIGLWAHAMEDAEEEWPIIDGARGPWRDIIGMPVAICLGCEIKSVDCENGVLTRVDGRQVQKDLVIIADGAHSSLLADFLGHPPATQPTGRSVYSWLVSMEDVMADPELAEQYRYTLPGFLSWVDVEERILWANYTCGGGTLLNNTVVHDTDNSSSQSSSNGCSRDHGAPSERVENGTGNEEEEENTLWHTHVSKETVLKTLHGFHPAVRRIVSMDAEEGIRVHKLYKRPPLESFVRGRTAVIGDAAHLMMPTHDAGPAIAIESASVLEVLFSGLEGYTNSPDEHGRGHIIRERLRLFDKLRIPRCNLTMLVSNAGPEWPLDPGLEQEIRRFYHGPLPQKGALPWCDEFREVLFHYDAFEAAKQALSDEKAKGNGAIHHQQ